MRRITELPVPLDYTPEMLRQAVLRRLAIPDDELLDLSLFKRSYDPQKKGYGGRKPTDLGDSMREELLADWEPEPLGECWAERGHGGRCGGPTLVRDLLTLIP